MARAALVLVVPVVAQPFFLAQRSRDDCPGGSLSVCIDSCPKDQSSVYPICVGVCMDRCSGAPTPSPQPATAPMPTPVPVPVPIPSPTPSGDCSIFQKESENCDSDCGRCFNAGSRAGVMCNGSGPGYYCPPDSPDADGDMAFACMDWTFGSRAMQVAEAEFKQRTGNDVYFGVGTFGTSDDVIRGIGACYRMQIGSEGGGVAKDLLVQSINTGSDVSGFQFDLQTGDGGAGAFNTCAGGASPGHDTMYPGPYSADTWGRQYGGADARSQCKNLPSHPSVNGPMMAAGDDLVTLCEWGFDHGVRGPNGENPSILNIGRVQCPAELVEFTQIKRNDDPSEFTCGSNCQQAEHECLLNSGGHELTWCLTRMMDCRKPSAAFIDNVKDELMMPGYKVVQPCTSDGYSRIDVQCGCYDCYC